MKRIAVIPGDGIGEEVIDGALEVLNAFSFPFKYEWGEAGDAVKERKGVALPEETLELCKESDAVLFGAVGETAADVIIKLRMELQTFANIRPAKSFKGVKSLYDDVDIVIVRENTECLYKGLEFEVADGITEGIRIITRNASEKIAHYAFELAKKERRKKVTALHKANVMRKTCALFRDVCRTVAKEYPEIEFNDYYIDAACMYLVMDPWRFDVIVTTNMFGDIVSDLAAGLVGGLGLAPSGNIGEKSAIFEPVHGSAPDIAGKGIANPSAAILSATMMLKHFGFIDEANKIEKTLEKVILEGKTTPDLGGKLKTDEMVREITKNLELS
jgi:3-isopropylmalate dehydrogenase